jgi:hypothetical protein
VAAGRCFVPACAENSDGRACGIVCMFIGSRKVKCAEGQLHHCYIIHKSVFP